MDASHLEPCEMPKPVPFAFSIPMKVAWGDMDAFGHVNNVSYARYFETARAEFFSSFRLWAAKLDKQSSGPVLIHMDLDYRKQTVYPETLSITVGITSASRRSFSMGCSMWNEKQECVLTATADFMWFDFDAGKPSTIPEQFHKLALAEAERRKER
jgi:acyl-CoA thioester hydrolase